MYLSAFHNKQREVFPILSLTLRSRASKHSIILLVLAGANLTNENGEKFRTKIVQAIKSHGNNLESNPEHMKYRCTINNDAYEEILSYNEILHHLEKDENTDVIWKFKGISAHQGPLAKNHPDYKGSSYNVRVD